MDNYIFPCPSCLQIIDNTMRSCKFCGAPIDPATATAAAALQKRVQMAYLWASATRNFSMVMPALFLLSFVPIEFSDLFLKVEEMILLAVPFFVIGWRQRFGKLDLPDPDLARARRALRPAALMWVAMVIVNVLWFLFKLFLGGHAR